MKTFYTRLTSHKKSAFRRFVNQMLNKVFHNRPQSLIPFIYGTD